MPVFYMGFYVIIVIKIESGIILALKVASEECQFRSSNVSILSLIHSLLVFVGDSARSFMKDSHYNIETSVFFALGIDRHLQSK